MPASDHLGYYAALGVPPDATPAQIAAAFRQLATELHPDRNPTAEARERFKRVTEAYHVLGNPERRAAYDDSGPANQERKIEPVCCDRCGSITAQPRFVVYRRVLSLIFRTISTPVKGVFCSKCAAREALKASAFSAVLGWWGVPWGPIFTIREIIRNALGGERPKGAEQMLLWTNALAFYLRRDLVISYGLARRVQSLEGNNEIAAHASDLVSELHRMGVPRDTPPLKNPWKMQSGSAALHLALLFAVPLTFFGLLNSSVGAAMFAPPKPIAQYASGGAPSPPAQPIGATLAQCPTPPTNGQIMGGTPPDADPGHQLEIDNGTTGPVIVKVRNATTGALAFSFFVQQGATATVKGISDGDYRIQYAIGDAVSADCSGLANIRDLEEFPGVQTLTTRYTETQVETQTLSYTLYPVPGGNVTPQGITADSFNAA